VPANLYEYAYMLEKGIRNSGEFATLKQAYENVQANSGAKALFDHFRHLQLKLQEKQVQGLPITEEEAKQAQASMAAAQANPAIVQLINAEQRLSAVLNEINKILVKPIEELYAGK